MTLSRTLLEAEIKALRVAYAKAPSEYVRGLANSLIWAHAYMTDTQVDLIPQYVPPTMGAIIGRAMRK